MITMLIPLLFLALFIIAAFIFRPNALLANAVLFYIYTLGAIIVVLETVYFWTHSR